MVKTINLSTRLTAVASYINKGAHFADIGSDHAYLPCYVCLKDKTAKAIAGEVNEGPYNSARETVTSYQLTDVIDVRLGNGLEVIRPGDELNHVVIAGMGGSLIKSILEDGKDKLKHVKRIIAQPNVDARNVRKWLVENHYFLTNEEIVEENGHIYEIIVADYSERTSEKEKISGKELLFGPILLKKKTKEFYKKWQHEFEKLQRIVLQMKHAKVQDIEKIKQFEQELVWMEEVLQDGKSNQ
ncbi:tRNA (adenine(22)-N(1))-methyltransferase [Oceanobacillus salinisoli]|uniref:tRNA (adenine(22)-N(1))-methyltransferase n=1 Tax=Oceanobacillus salinisoli TaxID=2678611 RepID=UPI0012E2E755|nr:tRNA (adenine(22)-N(1))-methyltransferase TrmK [Oceanobacillus salinisoli]